MKKILFLLALVWLMVACSSNTQDSDQPVVIDYETLEPVDFFSTETFSDITPVYLDTNGSVLGSPLHMKIKNGNYYIFDAQQQFIYTFDAAGNMLYKLARTGRAKGEYTFVKDFDIQDNGNIELLCEADAKLLRYKPDGEFIEEKELGYYAMSFIITDNGYFFSKDWYANSLTQDNTVIRKDANLNILGGMLPKKDFMFANFPNMSFSQSGENLPIYKHIYDKDIYRIINDTLKLAYKIEFGKKAFPEQLFSMENTMEAYNLLMSMTFANIQAAFENKDYLVLFVLEDGLEHNGCYLLYDKATQKAVSQKFPIDDDTFACFNNPVALTPQNEIVFIVEPESLKGIEGQNPLFSALDTTKLQEGSGYVILKMKIR